MKVFIDNFKILIRKHKSPFFLIISSFLILSCIEAFGIGLLIPLFSKIEFSNIDNITNSLNNIPFLEKILNELNVNTFQEIVLLIATAFLIKTIFAFILNYIINRYVFGNQRRFIIELSEKYIFNSTQNIEKKESSQVIQNLLNNSDTVALGSMLGTIRFLSEGIFVSVILVTLIIIKPLTTILAILFILLIMLSYQLIFNEIIKKTGKNAALSRTNLIKNTQILISSHKELKIYNRLEYFINLMNNFARELEKNTVIYKSLSMLPKYYIETAFMIFIITIVLFTSNDSGILINSIPIVGIYLVAIIRLIPSLSILMSSLVQINNSLYALDIIAKELSQVIVGFDNSFEKEKSLNYKYPKEIKFKNVFFGYDDINKNVLTNINLSIQPNTLTLIKGKSGSGKTTFLNLLSGLYLPSSGCIKNAEIESPKNNEIWTQQFAYLPQSPNVFSDTIKANIVLETDKSKVQNLDKILKMVDLYDLVNSLPSQIDTKIDEFGSNLSGGQRQRLNIARALYFNRPVLIFDEPTSALDDLTAKKIVKIIKDLIKTKSIIVSSHDDRFDSICTKKIIIENSKIFEIN